MITRLFTILVLIEFFHHTQLDNWNLVRDENGITVYTRKIPDSEYYAFKAEMTVSATDSAIFEILWDISQYPEWFAYTASAESIEQSLDEQIFSMETDYPWPYSNECMNYQMNVEHKQNGSKKISITESNKPVECKKSLNKSNGHIILQPHGERTKIIYSFHSEPNQKIPPWLINPRIHEMPFKTLNALKEKLRGE